MDDIAGKRYGRLVAVKFVEYRQYKRHRMAHWIFKCDYGNEKVMTAGSVKRSCGCLYDESRKILINYKKRCKERYSAHCIGVVKNQVKSKFDWI